MSVQEYIVKVTNEAMVEAFNYAKAVPEDKRDWKPLGVGQSVLSMARELAKCSDWGLAVLTDGNVNWEPGENVRDEMFTWATLDECESVCKKKLARYCAFIANFSGEKFTDTKTLPFGANRSMRTLTMLELMDYVRWNASYHQGQIAYIQTLYGDKDLH